MIQDNKDDIDFDLDAPLVEYLFNCIGRLVSGAFDPEYDFSDFSVDDFNHYIIDFASDYLESRGDV